MSGTNRKQPSSPAWNATSKQGKLDLRWPISLNSETPERQRTIILNIFFEDNVLSEALRLFNDDLTKVKSESDSDSYIRCKYLLRESFKKEPQKSNKKTGWQYELETWRNSALIEEIIKEKMKSAIIDDDVEKLIQANMPEDPIPLEQIQKFKETFIRLYPSSVDKKKYLKLHNIIRQKINEFLSPSAVLRLLFNHKIAWIDNIDDTNLRKKSSFNQFQSIKSSLDDIIRKLKLNAYTKQIFYYEACFFLQGLYKTPLLVVKTNSQYKDNQETIKNFFKKPLPLDFYDSLSEGKTDAELEEVFAQIESNKSATAIETIDYDQPVIADFVGNTKVGPRLVSEDPTKAMEDKEDPIEVTEAQKYPTEVTDHEDEEDPTEVMDVETEEDFKISQEVRKKYFLYEYPTASQFAEMYLTNKIFNDPRQYLTVAYDDLERKHLAPIEILCVLGAILETKFPKSDDPMVSLVKFVLNEFFFMNFQFTDDDFTKIHTMLIPTERMGHLIAKKQEHDEEFTLQIKQLISKTMWKDLLLSYRMPFWLKHFEKVYERRNASASSSVSAETLTDPLEDTATQESTVTTAANAELDAAVTEVEEEAANIISRKRGVSDIEPESEEPALRKFKESVKTTTAKLRKLRTKRNPSQMRYNRLSTTQKRKLKTLNEQKQAKLNRLMSQLKLLGDFDGVKALTQEVVDLKSSIQEHESNVIAGKETVSIEEQKDLDIFVDVTYDNAKKEAGINFKNAVDELIRRIEKDEIDEFQDLFKGIPKPDIFKDEPDYELYDHCTQLIAKRILDKNPAFQITKKDYSKLYESLKFKKMFFKLLICEKIVLYAYEMMPIGRQKNLTDEEEFILFFSKKDSIFEDFYEKFVQPIIQSLTKNQIQTERQYKIIFIDNLFKKYFDPVFWSSAENDFIKETFQKAQNDAKESTELASDGSAMDDIAKLFPQPEKELFDEAIENLKARVLKDNIFDLTNLFVGVEKPPILNKTDDDEIFKICLQKIAEEVFKANLDFKIRKDDYLHLYETLSYPSHEFKTLVVDFVCSRLIMKKMNQDQQSITDEELFISAFGIIKIAHYTAIYTRFVKGIIDGTSFIMTKENYKVEFIKKIFSKYFDEKFFTKERVTLFVNETFDNVIADTKASVSAIIKSITDNLKNDPAAKNNDATLQKLKQTTQKLRACLQVPKSATRSRKFVFNKLPQAKKDLLRIKLFNRSQKRKVLIKSFQEIGNVPPNLQKALDEAKETLAQNDIDEEAHEKDVVSLNDSLEAQEIMDITEPDSIVDALSQPIIQPKSQPESISESTSSPIQKEEEREAALQELAATDPLPSVFSTDTDPVSSTPAAEPVPSVASTPLFSDQPEVPPLQSTDVDSPLPAVLQPVEPIPAVITAQEFKEYALRNKICNKSQTVDEKFMTFLDQNMTNNMLENIWVEEAKSFFVTNFGQRTKEELNADITLDDFCKLYNQKNTHDGAIPSTVEEPHTLIMFNIFDSMLFEKMIEQQIRFPDDLIHRLENIHILSDLNPTPWILKSIYSNARNKELIPTANKFIARHIIHESSNNPYLLTASDVQSLLKSQISYFATNNSVLACSAISNAIQESHNRWKTSMKTSNTKLNIKTKLQTFLQQELNQIELNNKNVNDSLTQPYLHEKSKMEMAFDIGPIDEETFKEIVIFYHDELAKQIVKMHGFQVKKESEYPFLFFDKFMGDKDKLSAAITQFKNAHDNESLKGRIEISENDRMEFTRLKSESDETQRQFLVDLEEKLFPLQEALDSAKAEIERLKENTDNLVRTHSQEKEQQASAFLNQYMQSKADLEAEINKLKHQQTAASADLLRVKQVELQAVQDRLTQITQQHNAENERMVRDFSTQFLFMSQQIQAQEGIIMNSSKQEVAMIALRQNIDEAKLINATLLAKAAQMETEKQDAKMELNKERHKMVLMMAAEKAKLQQAYQDKTATTQATQAVQSLTASLSSTPVIDPNDAAQAAAASAPSPTDAVSKVPVVWNLSPEHRVLLAKSISDQSDLMKAVLNVFKAYDSQIKNFTTAQAPWSTMPKNSTPFTRTLFSQFYRDTSFVLGKVARDLQFDDFKKQFMTLKTARDQELGALRTLLKSPATTIDDIQPKLIASKAAILQVASQRTGIEEEIGSMDGIKFDQLSKIDLTIKVLCTKDNEYNFAIKSMSDLSRKFVSVNAPRFQQLLETKSESLKSEHDHLQDNLMRSSSSYNALVQQKMGDAATSPITVRDFLQDVEVQQRLAQFETELSRAKDWYQENLEYLFQKKATSPSSFVKHCNSMLEKEPVLQANVNTFKTNLNDILTAYMKDFAEENTFEAQDIRRRLQQLVVDTNTCLQSFQLVQKQNLDQLNSLPRKDSNVFLPTLNSFREQTAAMGAIKKKLTLLMISISSKQAKKELENQKKERELEESKRDQQSIEEFNKEQARKDNETLEQIQQTMAQNMANEAATLQEQLKIQQEKEKSFTEDLKSNDMAAFLANLDKRQRKFKLYDFKRVQEMHQYVHESSKNMQNLKKLEELVLSNIDVLQKALEDEGGKNKLFSKFVNKKHFREYVQCLFHHMFFQDLQFNYSYDERVKEVFSKEFLNETARKSFCESNSLYGFKNFQSAPLLNRFATTQSLNKRRF